MQNRINIVVHAIHNARDCAPGVDNLRARADVAAHTEAAPLPGARPRTYPAPLLASSRGGLVGRRCGQRRRRDRCERRSRCAWRRRPRNAHGRCPVALSHASEWLLIACVLAGRPRGVRVIGAIVPPPPFSHLVAPPTSISDILSPFPPMPPFLAIRPGPVFRPYRPPSYPASSHLK